MSDEIKPRMTAEGRRNVIDFLRSFDVMMRTDWMERTLEMYQKMQAAADELERPFGFTREDVEVIEGAITALRRIATKDESEMDTAVFYRPRLRTISDRIEALLPPEDSDGRQ